jgi:hypothetical protein
MSESGERRRRGGQDAASRVHGLFFLYPRTSRLEERAVRRIVAAEYYKQRADWKLGIRFGFGHYLGPG